MGKMNGPYVAEFPVGTIVAVAERSQLDAFRLAWQHHHPLTAEQLRFAGAVARVAHVGFYHGGDELYGLEGIPGTWHESCLRRQALGASIEHDEK